MRYVRLATTLPCLLLCASCVRVDVVAEDQNGVVVLGRRADKVFWSHATNSVAELHDALTSKQVNFIEADVMASEDGSDPIMCHPPATSSDLTLQTFLAGIEAFNEHTPLEDRKSTKLDLKNPLIVPTILKDVEEVLTRVGGDALGEVWLNADIFTGPLGPPTVFDADTFVQNVTRFMTEGNFPDIVLSIGWTVGTGAGGGYQDEHVQEMLGLCRKYSLQGGLVTFAMNTFHFCQRPEAVQQMIDAPEGYSVTLWGPTIDPCRLSVEALQKRYPTRVYVDISKPRFLESLKWYVGRFIGRVK